jgi:hypothetical protein
MLQPLKVLKVSICSCGFRALADHVEVGTVYRVDLEDVMHCTLICGGCRLTMPVETVFVASRGSARAGYLPRELFAGD